MGDTIAAIREQNGIVYLPHPFDRLHTIPDAPILHRHLAEIDVFEVYNARLLFEGSTTRRSASRASTTSRWEPAPTRTCSRASAPGSCACGPSRRPEEFLIGLRSAEIVRRPKSLVYLQGLKWVAQARGRKASVR